MKALQAYPPPSTLSVIADAWHPFVTGFSGLHHAFERKERQGEDVPAVTRAMEVS